MVLLSVWLINHYKMSTHEYFSSFSLDTDIQNMAKGKIYAYVQTLISQLLRCWCICLHNILKFYLIIFATLLKIEVNFHFNFKVCLHLNWKMSPDVWNNQKKLQSLLIKSVFKTLIFVTARSTYLYIADFTIIHFVCLSFMWIGQFT